MRRILAVMLLLSLAVPLSACVVEPGGGGWCYWHPLRCRR